MTKLVESIVAAEAADTAFQEAINRAGYKSRWDWDRADKRPLPAYHAKLEADWLMHQAFIASK